MRMRVRQPDTGLGGPSKRGSIQKDADYLRRSKRRQSNRPQQGGVSAGHGHIWNANLSLSGSDLEEA